MFKAPNEYRNRTHPQLGTPDTAGNNGLFIFGFKGKQINCIVSDGAGWEHVSVTTHYQGKKMTHAPDWDTMNVVKDLFWDEGDTVIQYHPPKKVYVNFHPYCLHLWRPIGIPIPVPPTQLIGPKLTPAQRAKLGLPILDEPDPPRIIRP